MRKTRVANLTPNSIESGLEDTYPLIHNPDNHSDDLIRMVTMATTIITVKNNYDPLSISIMLKPLSIMLKPWNDPSKTRNNISISLRKVLSFLNRLVNGNQTTEDLPGVLDSEHFF